MDDTEKKRKKLIHFVNDPKRIKREVELWKAHDLVDFFREKGLEDVMYSNINIMALKLLFNHGYRNFKPVEEDFNKRFGNKGYIARIGDTYIHTSIRPLKTFEYALKRGNMSHNWHAIQSFSQNSNISAILKMMYYPSDTKWGFIYFRREDFGETGTKLSKEELLRISRLRKELPDLHEEGHH